MTKTHVFRWLRQSPNGMLWAPDPIVTPNEPPSPDTEAIARAQYEADAARAEATKVKKQLEEMQKQLPSEEQRAKWAELEAKERTAEEDRMKKAGEFDGWRAQISEKHTKELDEKRQQVENERAKADQTEKELNETLIGRSFADTLEWFGPTGKTVLMPAVAQSYFAPHVSVEVVPGTNGNPARRRVIVKDHHGAVVIDAKSGQPMPFAQAIGEVIEAHPDKKHLLRGSGKVGSGSAGGEHGMEGRDLSRLTAKDFKDPKVRDAVREQLAAPGGLKIGPGFDAIEQAKRDRKP
jgi:hypothetical protein